MTDHRSSTPRSQAGDRDRRERSGRHQSIRCSRQAARAGGASAIASPGRATRSGRCRLRRRARRRAAAELVDGSSLIDVLGLLDPAVRRRIARALPSDPGVEGNQVLSHQEPDRRRYLPDDRFAALFQRNVEP
jgi:hypothetical protein